MIQNKIDKHMKTKRNTSETNFAKFVIPKEARKVSSKLKIRQAVPE